MGREAISSTELSRAVEAVEDLHLLGIAAREFVVCYAVMLLAAERAGIELSCLLDVVEFCDAYFWSRHGYGPEHNAAYVDEDGQPRNHAGQPVEDLDEEGLPAVFEPEARGPLEAFPVFVADAVKAYAGWLVAHSATYARLVYGNALENGIQGAAEALIKAVAETNE